MNEQFTVEEINLICVFDTSSRDAVIAGITTAIPEFDESEIVEIAESVLNKLAQMTGADFSALKFYPEYGDYDNYDDTEV
jgi:hypothetical protein